MATRNWVNVDEDAGVPEPLRTAIYVARECMKLVEAGQFTPGQRRIAKAWFARLMTRRREVLSEKNKKAA